MTLLDWLIVILLNGAVIAVGFYLARGTETSAQWFLGGRSLPWWAVGLSMFATNVDNADIVGVTGSTFKEGIHIITVYALGSAIGGILAAFFVVPSMYRRGFFTNAEYLEGRFGASTRVISALIQLQYRSSMLGMMTYSVFLLLTKLLQIHPVWSWVLIVTIVVCSGLYTAFGGLRSVVWTDALQGIVMLAGGLVIFVAVWNGVGGWSGTKESLAKITLNAKAESDKPPDTEKQPANNKASPDANSTKAERPGTDLLHIGKFYGDDDMTSPIIVAIGWIIIASGYWTVNHTQTMRLMGTRSLWDMKMAALFGIAASLPIMIACACLGVFGRALPEFTDLEKVDSLYPLLANKFLGVGLKGVVVASIVAAAISTFDSMGSALSAIFTRDIYARFIVRDAEDKHYLVVGRLATVGVLMLGFLYLPFIAMQGNMIKAFTTLIPVFVTPLFTVYLAGVLTKAHRASGLIGLLVGSTYGIIALIDRAFLASDQFIPSWLSGRWPALLWSFGITSLTIWITTLAWGRHTEDKADFKEKGWLGRSRTTLPPVKEHPFRKSVPVLCSPTLWAVVVLVACSWVVFGVFW